MSQSEEIRTFRGSKRQEKCKPVKNFFLDNQLQESNIQLPDLVFRQVKKLKNINCEDIEKFEFKTDPSKEILDCMRNAAQTQMAKILPNEVTRVSDEDHEMEEKSPSVVSPDLFMDFGAETQRKLLDDLIKDGIGQQHISQIDQYFKL